MPIQQNIQRFRCFFRGRFEPRAGFHHARRDLHHAIVAEQPDHTVRRSELFALLDEAIHQAHEKNSLRCSGLGRNEVVAFVRAAVRVCLNLHRTATVAESKRSV